MKTILMLVALVAIVLAASGCATAPSQPNPSNATGDGAQDAALEMQQNQVADSFEGDMVNESADVDVGEMI
jgi:hypothetical protein